MTQPEPPSERRLRVIWVTRDVPDPAGIPAQAAEHTLLAALSDRHDVRLVCLELPQGEGTLDVGGPKVPTHGVDWRPRSFSIARSGALQRLEFASQLFFDPKPRQQALLGDGPRAVAGVVALLVEHAQFDLVHVSRFELAPALFGLGVPVVTVVAISQNHEDETSSSRSRLRRRIDGRKLRRLLRRVVRDSAAVGAATPTDRDSLVELARPDVPVVDARELEDLWFAAAERIARTRLSKPKHGRARRGLPPAPAPRSVSIVIPTANRTHLLRRALPTVAAAASRVPGTEIVVVEEGAVGAADLCSELGIDATVIHEGHGAAQKRNIGTAASHGDVVLFTDDDCEVPASWVEDHLAALTADPEVTATFGVVTGLSRRGGYDPVGLRLVHRADALPWRVGHTSNMGIRRAALVAVGGFDERLGPGTALGGGEDHDLMARVLAAGGVMLTGVGDPVSHADWREDEDHVRNLRAYERGAGLWIGKALRTERAAAWGYVRGRVRLIRDRWLEAPAGGRREVLVHITLLGRGILMGYRLAGPKHPRRWLGKR